MTRTWSAVPGGDELAVDVADGVPDGAALERAQLRRLRRAALVEASTLVVLLGVAVPLKHLAGVSAATAVVGPIHGLAFLAYCWTVLETVSGGGWARAEVARLVVSAVIPLAGFTTGPLLRRKAAALGGDLAQPDHAAARPAP